MLPMWGPLYYKYDILHNLNVIKDMLLVERMNEKIRYEGYSDNSKLDNRGSTLLMHSEHSLQ